jgi:hypothetical protein
MNFIYYPKPHYRMLVVLVRTVVDRAGNVSRDFIAFSHYESSYIKVKCKAIPVTSLGGL